MNLSRILPTIKTLALAFAAKEVEAAAPYVKKAVDELDDDLRATDPIGAFVATAKAAYDGMKADAAFTDGLSLTGILGAVASVALAGFKSA
jgi:hypothetical protein